MAQSNEEVISMKTRRYSELLRRILMAYRDAEILIDKKPHVDADDLLKHWCTNANIQKTRDFEVLRDGKSLFGFHDGPSGFFWAAISERTFVEQLASERIIRYRIIQSRVGVWRRLLEWLRVVPSDAPRSKPERGCLL